VQAGFDVLASFNHAPPCLDHVYLRRTKATRSHFPRVQPAIESAVLVDGVELATKHSVSRHFCDFIYARAPVRVLGQFFVGRNCEKYVVRLFEHRHLLIEHFLVLDPAIHMTLHLC
jgi:hypothetical protein